MAKTKSVQIGKKEAIEALKQRIANPPDQIQNQNLKAGSPMYFYCKICGQPSDRLPENYTTSPERICKECKVLEDKGWLTEAVAEALS